MPVIRHLERFEGALNTTLSVVSSVWIFAIMVLVCADVASRTLFNAPIAGVAEFIAMSIVGCVFLQLPSAISQRRLLRVEMLIEALEARRPRLAATFNLVFALAGAFLFFKIVAWAWPDFFKAWDTEEFKGAQGSFMIPIWPFKLVFLIGALFGLIQFVKLAAIEAGGLLRRLPPDNGTHVRVARADALGLATGAMFVAAIGGFLAFMLLGDHRPIEVGVYCLAAMLTLIVLGMPIPLVLMSLSFVGIWAARGAEFMAANTLGIAATSAVSSYEFGVIPLFIMMGFVLEKADVGRDAYRVAVSLLRGVSGGLGIATVFANAIFAAIVGSSIASAAVFSKIAVPEMIAHGYSKRFSVGCVAGSSVLGMLIPPSLLLIIYGLVAEESVGKLFVAAVIPGVILAVAFSASIYAMARVAPSLVGTPRAAIGIEPASAREIVVRLAPIVLLVTCVIGGIYGGVFTPTEAAAVGTALALLIAFGKRRIDWKSFRQIVLETGYVSAAILFVVIAASLYTRQVALTGIPAKVADWMGGAGLEMVAFLAVYFVIVLLLGMILDSVSIMLIVLPIVIPLVIALGGDKIWFGIVTTIAIEIGLLTPPFGLSVYVVKGVLPKDYVTLSTIFAGAFPFVLVMIVVTVFIMAFPGLSLWLLRL